MTRDEVIGELSVLYERYSNGMGWRDGRYEEALQIAIEYLEDIEEPTGDYISRADAIEAVEQAIFNHDSAIMRITALPSAEAYFTDGNKIAEWIPCSDRLPSEDGDYLCTIPLNADETYTEVLTFYKGKFYEDDTDEWGALYHDDVLAWMPLPTPYKGGDSE